MIIALAARALVAGCTISSAPGVEFGTYDFSSAAPLDSMGTISLRCTADTAGVTVSINAGSSPSFYARSLKNTRLQELMFNLYLDVARTVVWGDGNGGSARYGPVSLAADVTSSIYVYARIPPLQRVGAGRYSEQLIVTLDF